MVTARKLMLLADRPSYQTQKVVIAAALVGIPLQTQLQQAEEELLQLVPHAKSVVLKIESGHGAPPQYLTRSNVVLRYLASLDEQSQLYGTDLLESARVDQWLDFCFNSLEVPAAALHLARDKVVQVSPAVTAAAQKEVEGTLKVIDAALQDLTFLAGEQVTVADVALLCALLELLQDKPTLLHHYPVLGRWCLTLLHHPKIAAELPDAKRLIKSVCEGNGNHTAFTPSKQRIDGAQTACKAAGDVRGLAATSGATGTQAAIDGPETTLFHRGRVLVSEVLAKGSAMVESEVTVKGWARTIREANKGELIFIELTDGSSAKTLQVILTDGKTEGFTEVRPSASGGVGASFSVRGKVVDSPAKGQQVELHGEWVEVVGKVYGGDNGSVGGKLYPLSKKAHSLEYLRTIAHLRPRTRVIGSVVRLRHAMAFATHKFFNDRGFKYIHTPIITAADCEGAGEQFCVTTVLPDGEKQKLPTLPNGMVDYSKDFFGQRTCLTVSGQLNVESFACALSDVYTFGPTFRAENSHTTRHLAEFWMIEPEIAFADLEKDMALAEDYLKYCVWYALTHHDEDLALLEKHPDGEPGLRERLQNVLHNPFQRLTYTDAVQLLQDEIAAGKVKFEVYPTWGCDLGSEHERYITEKVYKKPVIVTNYPKEIKAFYMRVDEGGKTVSAMDILVPKIGEIIGGSQREERFDVLVERCQEMGLDPKAVWWYLDLRRYGSVPHAGFGLGFERLILFVTGLENIRDVIPFPRYPSNCQF